MSYSTDKGTLHSYLEVYDELFKDLKNINLLEIGVQSGGSLELWRDKFPGSKIYGIDINPVEVEGTEIFIGDATKEEILDNFKNIKFDVIIDDGSHNIADQLKTLELFYPKLKKGGLYIIEDIQNIDQDKDKFKGGRVLDRRNVKGRYDDVLIIYTK